MVSRLVLPTPVDLLRALEHELFPAGWFNPEQLFQRLERCVRRAGAALTIQYADPWWIGHSTVDWLAGMDADAFTRLRAGDGPDDEWFAEDLDSLRAEPMLVAFSPHVVVASRGEVRVVTGADTPLGAAAADRFGACGEYGQVARLVAFTYQGGPEFLD